jgi:hypothetical protein
MVYLIPAKRLDLIHPAHILLLYVLCYPGPRVVRRKLGVILKQMWCGIMQPFHHTRPLAHCNSPSSSLDERERERETRRIFQRIVV